jgi:hypothetical protein
MKTYCRRPHGPVDAHLAQVVEPLASYICSTNRPKSALAAVLALLVSEVEQTIQTANAHLAGGVQRH